MSAERDPKASIEDQEDKTVSPKTAKSPEEKSKEPDLTERVLDAARSDFIRNLNKIH